MELLTDWYMNHYGWLVFTILSAIVGAVSGYKGKFIGVLIWLGILITISLIIIWK